jgi:hypothetical protein
MKKLIVLFMSMFAVANVNAQNQVDCNFTSISSNITTNTTLSATTLYRIEGCIHVTNGHTLTLPAGTTVMFEKSVSAALIIDKGAELVVNGTSTSPVIFTSDQTPGNKAYGDYDGLIIEGQAPNNVSGGSISLSGRTCSSLSGGGTTSADNSGTIEYLRIEYPKYGITLLSVGSGTTIDHVQVSYAANDAYQFMGGTVNTKYLISLNTKGADFRYEYGYVGLQQFLLADRRDAGAHTSTGDAANSIVMANNETGSSYTGTPMTHPVISNFTLIGPLHCNTGINSDFKNGVLLQHNTEAGLYNGFVDGWTTGLLISENPTINNVLVSKKIHFESSSFYENTPDFSSSGTWSGSACATSVSDWMMGTHTCSQNGNQQAPYTSGVGLSSTICGNYATTAPSFELSTNSLDGSDYIDYDELSNEFFDNTPDYRGALSSSSDWTASWTNWNPSAFNPCPEGKMIKSTAVNNLTTDNIAGLQLAPNPSNGTTYAIFSTPMDGNITISVVDNAGRVLRTTQSDVAKGNQHIAVETKGLAAGIYIINVQSSNSLMHAQLVVE